MIDKMVFLCYSLRKFLKFAVNKEVKGEVMYLNGNFLRGAESMETGRLLKKLEEEVRDWLGKRGEPTKSAGFFRRSRKNFEKKEVVVIIRRKLYSV